MRNPVRGALSAMLCALFLTTALAACGSDSDSDSASGQVIGSVDTAYGNIEVRAPEEGDPKIVALGWSDGEIALSLGYKPVAIFDWQGFGEEYKGVGPWATEQFGDVSPTIMPVGDGTFNYEQILMMEPDVILNVRSKLDDKVYERLSQIAPTISAPAGTPDYAINWREQTDIIAQALGKTAEGDAQVADTDAKITAAKEANPQFAGKTFVYGAKFGQAYGAYLPGDSRFDVFAEMGFVPNPPVQQLSASGFFANVPVERVAALDANVSALTTIYLPMSDLTGDPLINALPVVKDGRAVFLDEKSEVNQGLQAGTPQSLAVALDQAVPQVQQAVAKLPQTQ
ncbi:ABC transporter substrate-binding protein [Aldersonia kunmingensis]|uniref:ABC transporter substrate-binding protein n=1 Tax=Aldersonia kunmingensis TaxID=408066 RepID=UPI00082BFEF5|nr:ABC transporter substrate-binding protein [Aldersonia kunmingensis]